MSTSLLQAAQFVAHSSVIFNDEKTPFKVKLNEAGDPRMLLILGDNASGKSLAFRLAIQDLKKKKVGSTVVVSIRERVGNPMNEMASFAKTMMYGYEHEESTGANTFRVLDKAFEQDISDYCCVGIDEPEIGMSERLHTAIGQLIFEKFQADPERLVILISHSRKLVRSLVGCMETPPILLMCGEQEANLEAWLQDDSDLSLDYLKALDDQGHAGRMAVHKLLK